MRNWGLWPIASKALEASPSTDLWVSHLGSRCFNSIQTFRWLQAPADTLTATPWQTLTQNHSAKPLSDSRPSETIRRCLLFQVTKFWYNFYTVIDSYYVIPLFIPSGPLQTQVSSLTWGNLTRSHNCVRPNPTIDSLSCITQSMSVFLDQSLLDTTKN